MMGTQFIICVETNQKCNSDYIYIKSAIEQFYLLDNASVRLSPVYMDGKGNYCSKKNIEKNCYFEPAIYCDFKKMQKMLFYVVLIVMNMILSRKMCYSCKMSRNIAKRRSTALCGFVKI